jgi:hypothetical protein
MALRQWQWRSGIGILTVRMPVTITREKMHFDQAKLQVSPVHNQMRNGLRIPVSMVSLLNDHDCKEKEQDWVNVKLRISPVRDRPKNG